MSKDSGIELSKEEQELNRAVHLDNVIGGFETFLLCPKCWTTLKFATGNSDNPELQRDPYYGCPKCRFEIDIDIEATLKSQK